MNTTLFIAAILTFGSLFYTKSFAAGELSKIESQIRSVRDSISKTKITDKHVLDGLRKIDKNLSDAQMDIKKYEVLLKE